MPHLLGYPRTLAALTHLLGLGRILNPGVIQDSGQNSRQLAASDARSLTAWMLTPICGTFPIL
jgi:hypothetical protein